MRLAPLFRRSSRQFLTSNIRNDLVWARTFSAAAAVDPTLPGSTIAFVGLGAMGYQMAKRLATSKWTLDSSQSDGSSLSEPLETGYVGARLHRGSSIHRGMEQALMRKVLVWNRTASIAVQHAAEFRSENISTEGFDHRLREASIIFMCLPTSDITFDCIKAMEPHILPNAIVVDCCTGNPAVTVQIEKWLGEVKPEVNYMDCPVSGGPGGASKGTLAAMLGGNPDVVEIVRPHISAFAGKVVYLGPTSSGHAVKAINNACNVSNLLCLHEGLLALKKMGVDPSAALEVINKSSGRSLMSQDRVPQEVITGDFNYGFKLGLMAKDVSIATELMEKYFPSAQVYRRTLKVHFDAMAAGTVNYDSDYTEIVKHQELLAGTQLRNGSHLKKSTREAQASDAKIKELHAANDALRAEVEKLKKLMV